MKPKALLTFLVLLLAVRDGVQLQLLPLASFLQRRVEQAECCQKAAQRGCLCGREKGAQRPCTPAVPQVRQLMLYYDGCLWVCDR